MSIYKLFTDGAVTKNPGGEASYGFVLYKDNKQISFGYGVIGSGAKMNNEMAEYYAISQGLSDFIRRWDSPKSHLYIHNDNKFICSQLVNKPDGQLQQLKKVLDVKIKWIPRDRNVEADRLTKRLRRFKLPKY